jgi:hypothetical protein
LPKTSATGVGRAIPREEAEGWLTESFRWIDIVSRIRLKPSLKGVSAATVKAVAFRIAIYADSDGTRVLAGVSRLALVCELDYKTVKKALAVLRSYGLLTKVGTASGPLGGRKYSADEYWLTTPPDLMERLKMWSPGRLDEEVAKLRAANKGVAGARRPRNCVDNSSQEGELRGASDPATTSPPSGVAGTFGTGGEELRGNLGKSCGDSTTPLPTTDRAPSLLTDHDHPFDLDSPCSSTESGEDRISGGSYNHDTKTCGRSGCLGGCILIAGELIRCECGGPA